MVLWSIMEALSFCCHVYGVSEYFGSNRPFRIIWCVFSSIFKTTLPLCLEDGLSLSRNGICGGSRGCLSSPTLSGSFEISCEDRCASISSPACELLSPAHMWSSLGEVILFGQSLEKFFYHPLRWIRIHTCDVERVGKFVRRYLPRHCLVRGC